MSLRVAFRPGARRDVEAAHEWYRQRSDREAGRFLRELLLATRRIGVMPELGSLARGPNDAGELVRHVAIRRSRFRLFYVVVGDSVGVIAVVHDRQEPGSWHQRFAGTD